MTPTPTLAARSAPPIDPAIDKAIAPAIDKATVLRRQRRTPACLDLGEEEGAARGYSPGFVAVLAGKDKVALDLGRRAARAARPRPPREFRSGFLAGVVAALVLGLAGATWWRAGGEEAAPVAADAPPAQAPAAPAAQVVPPAASDAPASPAEYAPLPASRLTAADLARRGGPGHFASTAAISPGLAWPPNAAGGPEIRTAAAASRPEGDAPDAGAGPALAPVLKPPVPPRAATAPAPKPAATAARAPHDSPFAPLLDLLDPLTSQIDRSATPAPPRPENAGKRGDK